MMLRVQLERQTESLFPSAREYSRLSGSPRRGADRLKPGALVHAPGPDQPGRGAGARRGGRAARASSWSRWPTGSRCAWPSWRRAHERAGAHPAVGGSSTRATAWTACATCSLRGRQGGRGVRAAARRRRRRGDRRRRAAGCCRASSTCTCTCASRARRGRRPSSPGAARRWRAASPRWWPCPTPGRSTTRALVTRAGPGSARAAADLCRVYPAGAITKGLKGEELAEMGELRAAGCVCVTDDGRPVMNAGLMRRALQYARRSASR